MQIFAGSKLLFGVVVVSFLFVFGFAVTGPLRPLYIVEVGANTVQLGLIMALPSMISLFTRVPISTLSNRIGKRRLMFFSLTLSVVTTAIFAFIYDPIWFFPIISLAAFSWSVFSPIAIEIVSIRSTPINRGATMGVYFTSIGAAMLAGPILSSLLTLKMGLRQLFLISTTFPVLSLVAFLLLIKPWEREENRKVDEKEVESGGGSRGSLARIFKIKNVIALCSARVAFSLSMGIFSTIFPVYAKDILGLTPSLISLLFSFRGLTNVLIRMPAGRLSDKIGRRKPFLLAYVIIIIVFILLTYTENFTYLMIVMALYGVGWGMRVAPSTALLSESVASEDRTLALATFMTMFDVGSTMGALLAGFTANFLSPPILMFLCVPIMFSALIIFLIISKEII